MGPLVIHRGAAELGVRANRRTKVLKHPSDPPLLPTAADSIQTAGGFRLTRSFASTRG
ncbi:MAG: hypothetical protein RLZZ360_644 [Candidatus Parcubacteria bacterium]|jgi:hypothetical protein